MNLSFCGESPDGRPEKSDRTTKHFAIIEEGLSYAVSKGAKEVAPLL